MERESSDGAAVESLEALADQIFRRDLEHDEDGEAELQQLIHDFVHVHPEPSIAEEQVRRDEFACRSCRMVLHRSRLADGRRFLCVDCAAGDPSE